ncbi:hypothetical protein A3B19_02350 [Candidatus Giovannonibacteria bacterium RIFCSPLOWO2_01_FULL_46_32]|uniref:DUF86 domain-containing protein n=1 Tax=Candidatus Giovannonibacteria bacterium RIFCSPLOWO2_01_FULL_46_32 TaxID=1798353 RepID=A0A1F5XI57_9BACT|nr:MAG: hypothetical protein A3B19_02350 [Candidatus Giovannonibacteria bacterium RIFCSPLOWO2_01_FULL_46_32]
MTGDKDKVYVEHILESVSNIESFVSGKTYEEFLGDKLLQDGVVRELEIIGEAAKNISEEFKTSSPAIPWKYMTGMRDKLIHDYFSIDVNAVWKTAQEDLKPLKSTLENLIK